MIESIKTQYPLFQHIQYQNKINVRCENEVNYIPDVEYYTAQIKEWQYDNIIAKEKINTEWEVYRKYLEENIEKISELHKSGYEIGNLTLEEINNIYIQNEWHLEENEWHLEENEDYSLDYKIDRIKDQKEIVCQQSFKQREISINSLYESSYKGIRVDNNYTDSEIKKILELNEIKISSKNIEISKMLLGVGEDISKLNINRMKILEERITALDKKEEAQKAYKSIKEGKRPGTEVLIKDGKVIYTDNTIQTIRKDLDCISDDDILDVLQNKEEVTIINLKEMMLKNTQKILDRSQQNNTEYQKEEQQQLDGEIQDIRNHIKQIRLMLTIENATKLSQKMPLESSKLIEVVAGLQGIEEKNISNIVNEANIELTKESRKTLEDITQVKHLIGRYKNKTAATMAQGVNKLQDIHKVLLAYEEQETIPNIELGDKIKKLDEQIEQFINNHKLIDDKITKQSIEALIMNGIPLSVESIEDIRYNLTKLDIFIEEFTPRYALEWIKEGVNPYKVSVDNILEWLEYINLPKLKDNVAATIVDLEDNNKMTDVQKQKLIGLYRILDNVQKHKEEVVGYLFKNNLDLTIEKLDEAIKYVGKNHVIEKRIDLNFGEMENLVYTQDTARVLINKVDPQIDKFFQLETLLQDMPLQIDNTNLNSEKQIQNNLYPFIKQVIKKELDGLKNIDILPQSTKDKLNNLKKVSPIIIRVMEKHNIPLTINNLNYIQKMHENPNIYGELLKKNNIFEDTLPDSLKAFEKGIEEIIKEIIQEKDVCMNQGDLAGYKSYKQLEEMINVQKQIISNEGVYQIPFVFEGEMKMVNLYVKERKEKKLDKEKGIHMVISYDTDLIGNIKAYIYMKGNHITYSIQQKNTEVFHFYNPLMEKLVADLTAIGYGVSERKISGVEDDSNSPVLIPEIGDAIFEIII